MPRKKNFTTADGAIDKLFTAPKEEEPDESIQDTPIINDTQETKDTIETNVSKTVNESHVTHDTNVSKPTNKSKHYDERGKRAERFGLLLDERLKEDLKHLSMAKGSKSVNDFIIGILLEYVEQKENQTKLEQYRKLLQG